VNLPIGLATAMLSVRLLDRDKGPGFGKGADILGAVLITSALMLLVYTIVKPAADYGWGDGQTLSLMSASLGLFAAFIWREATASSPLIPLRIFRSRNVTGANTIQALFVAGMYGMFFLGSLYMQRVLGYDALEIGLAFLPVTVVIGTLSLGYSDRLILRFGPRAVLLPSLVLIGAGLVLFTQVPVDGSYVPDLLPTMLLLGAGAGLAFPALMTLAMGGVSQSDAGLASGLVNTTLQVGGALGLAVLATLSTTRSNDLIESGRSSASALTEGYQLAFLIGVGLVGVAIVVALTVLQRSEAVAERPKAEPVHSEVG
jgi:Major Facilitator Superfamily